MAAAAILKIGEISIVSWLQHLFTLIEIIITPIFNIWLHKYSVRVFPMIFVTKTAISLFFGAKCEKLWFISEKIYYDFIEPFYQINKAEFGEHVCLEFLRPPYYQIWMMSSANYSLFSKSKMAAAAILKIGEISIVSWLQHLFTLIEIIITPIFNIWLHKYSVRVFPMIFVTKTAISSFFGAKCEK